MNQGNVWGYIFRELRDDLRGTKEKGSFELRENEIELMDTNPSKVFPLVMRRAVALDALGDEAQERLTTLIDLLDPDDLDSGLEGCSFYLGFYSYDRRWLSADAVSERLGVTKARVYEMLKSGRIKGIKTGKTWVIFERSLPDGR